MATKVALGNRIIEEPGAYANIESGIKNPILGLDYGTLLMVDNGNFGANWGGGSGIAGTLKDGLDAVEYFEDIKTFQDKVMGGLAWDIANPLFYPNGFGSNGISGIYYIKATTSVPAEIAYTFTGGGSNGGNLVIQVRNEGPSGNGREGDQTLATADYTVTAVGAVTDTHTIQVNEGAGLIALGTYAVVGSPSLSDVATALAQDINDNTATHGYTATSDAAVVTVTMRNPTGFGKASDANTWVCAYAVTGTATGTAPANPSGGVDGTKTTKGYSAVMEAGPNSNPTTPDLFVIKYYVGTFRGLASDGDPYNNILEADTEPQLLITSAEFDNIEDLNDWMVNSAEFQKYFAIKTYTKTGDGSVDDADLTANTGTNLASGGTETYSTANLNAALDALVDIRMRFILCDEWNLDAKSANNNSLVAFAVGDSISEPIVFVGGGNDANGFTGANGSIGIAQSYNSEAVVVTHAGYKNLKRDGTSYRLYDSIYKAAAVLGRTAGVEPQVPATFKDLSFDADRHSMNEQERKDGLKYGVLHTKFDQDRGRFIINQGITSIQKNDFIINDDATTHEISIKRIKQQLKNLITYNAKLSILAQENGVNRFTLSPSTVIEWTKGFLQNQVATDIDDNIITGFEDVTVEVIQDTYKIRFGFYPNLPVNKLLFTGVMLDPFA